VEKKEGGLDSLQKKEKKPSFRSCLRAIMSHGREKKQRRGSVSWNRPLCGGEIDTSAPNGNCSIKAVVPKNTFHLGGEREGKKKRRRSKMSNSGDGGRGRYFFRA